MSGSGLPFRATTGLDQELVKYLDQLGTKASAVSNLAASPTNAEIATAFNSLLASLRAAGKMDT